MKLTFADGNYAPINRVIWKIYQYKINAKKCELSVYVKYESFNRFL